VQRTRFNELERTRKKDLLQKMKADINLSKEMLSTMRSAITMPEARGSMSRSSRPSMQRPQMSTQESNEAFFMTEAGGGEDDDY
jgi:hypothetical protein